MRIADIQYFLSIFGEDGLAVGLVELWSLSLVN
jgi:hypothetical protein